MLLCDRGSRSASVMPWWAILIIVLVLLIPDLLFQGQVPSVLKVGRKKFAG
jgi:hypothetical protein